MGQVNRARLPEVGARIEGEGRFEVAEVVEFAELRASCSMRRFKVIIRVVR